MEGFLRKAAQQVQKQQQAVLGKLSGTQKAEGQSTVVVDEAELQRFQALEKLNNATTAGKALQKDIVRSVDGIVASGFKTAELGSRLSEDCKKYGSEGPGSGTQVGRAALAYGGIRATLERDREAFHRTLQNQVVEPLKGMIIGAPLEDARHLFRSYEKKRDEASAQMGSVIRRTERARIPGHDPSTTDKLQDAKVKMGDITAAMAVLGKEAHSSLSAVEANQQRLTLQRLIDMVKLERDFHTRSAEMLDQLFSQLMQEKQRAEAVPAPTSGPADRDVATESTTAKPTPASKGLYFLAEVIYPFVPEGEGELILNVGDYVVVRSVSESGWSEGECKGKAGWFPSAYVEQRQKVPMHKVVEAGQRVAPNVS